MVGFKYNSADTAPGLQQEEDFSLSRQTNSSQRGVKAGIPIVSILIYLSVILY